MYERSAIVLERYFDNLLNYRRECNLRDNYNNYCELVEKLEKYQINYQKEVAATKEYNTSLQRIKEIQLTQKNLYKKSAKLEYDRNLLFSNLDGKIEDIRKCIEKIEEDVQENNASMQETKENLLGALEDYNEKKFELSKCKRYKKMAENDYNELYEISKNNYDGITAENIAEVKAFAKFDDEESIIETLAQNGKDEKIPFNEEVIECATKFGIEIAKKEAASYLVIYDKMTKLLSDIEDGTAKINLHKKYVRNEKAKIDFILAVKEYQVQFLDYERMTVIHGRKSHNRLMSEACENFNTDIAQIDNLYELLLKEISNKATKKAYKELYNKSYLTDIKEKEEKFKKEKNRVNLNTATLINSNYWRIDGIKGIYTTFYKNVSEVFGRDVAEFDIPKEFDENNSTIEEPANQAEEAKEEVVEEEVIEKIPFQIEEVVEEELEDYTEDINEKIMNINHEDIEEDDNNEEDSDEENDDDSIEDGHHIVFLDDENDEEAEENDDNFEEDDDEEINSSVNSPIKSSSVSPIKFAFDGDNNDEEFDIFGEKYKDIDFTESNVIAAKSKVEEEMNFADKKITRTPKKVKNENIFKKIELEDDLPYEVEEEEIKLFDNFNDAKTNDIEDFDLTKESAKKSGGMFGKLRKITGAKKNKFTDDIW